MHVMPDQVQGSEASSHPEMLLAAAKAAQLVIASRCFSSARCAIPVTAGEGRAVVARARGEG